jgi:hypothetical protein
MKKKVIACAMFLQLAGDGLGFSQGFSNLNFESAVINTNGGPFMGAVVASNAIPGWTAYSGGVADTYIRYNNPSLGASAINLMSTNFGGSGIEGKYYIWLQGANGTAPISQAIGQTGQIPLSALSLLFWGDVTGVQLFLIISHCHSV